MMGKGYWIALAIFETPLIVLLILLCNLECETEHKIHRIEQYQECVSHHGSEYYCEPY